MELSDIRAKIDSIDEDLLQLFLKRLDLSEEVAAYNTDGIWSRVIWDVTAVGWLMGGDLMEDRIVPSPIPQYDHHYSHDPSRHPAKYVWYINRDALMRDLITKLTK